MKMPDLKKPDLKMPNISLPGIKMPHINLILVVMGAVALHFIVAAGFLVQRGNARDNAKLELQKLESNWADEDQVRKEKQETELQQRYGTNKLDRIAADPRQNIQLSLLKLFKAVLDSENQVEVTVDRFNEFRVDITTGNLPEPAKLAGPLQEVFSRIDPKLVSEIVFSDGDRFYVIEPDQLQGLDWKTATPEQIVTACFPRK